MRLRQTLVAGGLSLSPAFPTAAQPAREAALPLLTNVKAIRALTSDEAARGYPVRIRGTVTYLNEFFASGMVLHDGQAGQFVLYTFAYVADHPKIDVRRGDLVEVEGHTTRGGFAPNVRPENVRKLGRSSLPSAKRLPFAALITGRHDCDYVEIVGVGQRAWLSEPPADTLFLEIAVEGGTVRASFWSAGAEHVDRFVDARVRLRGNVGALFGPTQQLRGVSLLAGRPDEVVVEEPPPDAFSLPIRPIGSLYKYSSGGELDRRIRVQGTVTYQRLSRPIDVTDFPAQTRFSDVRHVLYIRDGASAARVETQQSTPLRPGDVVDLAGFPAVSPTRPTLRNAIFRKLESGPEPATTVLSPANMLASENDAELVRMQAQVLGQVATPGGRALVLKAGETVFDAALESEATGAIESVKPGSVVSVTGIYAFQYGPPPSFRLLLRSPDDVVLVTAAPWWTLRHTLVVGLVVALVGSAAGLWVRIISHEHALARERYQAILNERSRLARELHDTLEQGLAGIKLQLEAVAGSVDGSPEVARHSLDVAREMLRYALNEARRSVLDLRSQALENGDLAGALSDLARQMTHGTPLTAEVRVVGAPRPLAASQEHHLLRIGLEALTNSIKHSGAAHIEIELHFGDGATELSVRDDGCGFAHDGVDTPAGHFGLRGIRERVDKLGGSLCLKSRPGDGTRLEVTVPLDPQRSQPFDQRVNDA